jgi:prepilin-type N-terminal cleavage/methylation domain-containing protein
VTRRTKRKPAPHRRGFTIVEMIFAVVMLAIGLLALAGLALGSARMTTGGGRQMAASAFAQARFDSLASVPCALLAPSGPQTGRTTHVRGVRESWAVTDGNHIKSVVDTLWVTGRARPLVYMSVIPCR